MKNKESQLTKLEKFGIISSFICSLIAVMFTIGEFVYDNILNKSEKIIILDEYESDYIFDGEKLYRNISIVIANNSDINVSIVEINIERGNEKYSFRSFENSICPINMESDETIAKVIPIQFEIDEMDKEFILNKYGKNCEIDAYELDTYFETGEDIQNLYDTATNPRIEIRLKTSKGNEIKFYKMSGAGGKF